MWIQRRSGNGLLSVSRVDRTTGFAYHSQRMNRGQQFALALITAIPLLFFGCSRGDKVVIVEPDDPEMVAAIAKARETLPQFWTTFAQPKSDETHFCLKVKITDKHGTEHFWADNIERKDGKITGTINNDAEIVKSVKLGDRIEIPSADISDWLYERKGKLVGCYTMKAMFKKMPAKEVDEFKSRLADP